MKYKDFYSSVLNESTLKLDLSSIQSAMGWVKNQNLDDVVDDDGNIDDDYVERISDYVDIYNNVNNTPVVKIYRLVKLDSIEQLEIENIGSYWSFQRQGVGDYGSGTRPFTGKDKYILTGLVNTSDIDWEHGFYSFLYYPDQFECALNDGARVEIIEINGEKLDNSLKANV